MGNDEISANFRNNVSLVINCQYVCYYSLLRNVDLGQTCDLKFDLSPLLCLKSLVVNHCSLVQMHTLKGNYFPVIASHLPFLIGLEHLVALESLSVAHNLLKSEALLSSLLLPLRKLKKLDLSRNILAYIPEHVCSLTRYGLFICYGRSRGVSKISIETNSPQFKDNLER